MKILRNLFIASLLLPGFVLADDATPFTPPPAPPQEYHAVSSDNPALLPASMPQAIAPAPVAAINASVDVADKTVSIATTTQKEVTDLTQNTLGFEQQTDQRIQALVASNRAMGTAIQSLMQSVTVLEEKSGQGSGNTMGFLQAIHAPEMEGFLLGASAILLLGTGILLGRLWRARARAKMIRVAPSAPATSASPTPEVSEAEYDFMSTSQAIPAKLDLARSYIAMNDLEQARTILKTVIEKGDSSQRNEAGQLLQKLLR
ncbi:MAG: FimV/HubP family polar landmark protein [Coxiellaceae bacterium]|nr:FimV/HubP family polar landmark protein [Coxiellaceae bacterium]